MSARTWQDGATWRNRAPRSVLDPLDPGGEPITTPADRRWLWRLEGDLAVSATNDTLRQLARDLSAYLHETCEHHWRDYEASTWDHPDVAEGDVIPAHRQCLWCSDVDWLDGTR